MSGAFSILLNNFYIYLGIKKSYNLKNPINLSPNISRPMQREEITHKIIGCAMKVHSTLGNGFQEVIYQRALAIEMAKQHLEFQREKEMTIFYDEIEIGTRRVDFFVEENIMVELKAISSLEDTHLAQAINYLEAYNMPVGLLINFGSKSMEFKRVYNTKHPDNFNHKKY